MKYGACALTGHRDLPASFNRRILFDELEDLIRKGCDTFFCGMAQGFDLTCLQLLIELKEHYPVYVEACVPFKGQENGFSFENRSLYRDLIKKCDHVTILFERYQNGCYLVRDRYMVDCSDFLFAYCTRSTGGTAYTVRYANSLNKKVVYSKAGEVF